MNTLGDCMDNRYIISDIETDGLLDTVSKFHCAWTYDKVTEEWTPFVQNLNDYVEFLHSKVRDGYKLVFHNGIKYDIPALSKLTNKDIIADWRDSCLDTLVLARLIYANIGDTDNRLMRSGRLPGKLFGSHSLKAYGYRLGVLKGTYGEQENAWDAYSPEMLEYCKQDVEVTRLLFDKLLNKGYPETAIQLEHDIAWLMAKQERNGFPFDSEKAVKLYAELAEKRQSLEEQLVKTFGSWYASKGEFTPKKDNKHIGYVARLWKVVTVDGVEESREIFNKSTYKASPKIVNVGTASADPNVSAVIGAALATGDEATINAAVAPYAASAAAILNPAPVEQPSQEEQAITGTVDESQITGGE